MLSHEGTYAGFCVTIYLVMRQYHFIYSFFEIIGYTSTRDLISLYIPLCYIIKMMSHLIIIIVSTPSSDGIQCIDDISIKMCCHKTNYHIMLSEQCNSTISKNISMTSIVHKFVFSMHIG